jgi:UDP-N-acetylmuramoylalanine--D-glutamate ligase
MSLPLTSKKPIGVMGLGKSGLATVGAFRRTNSPVWAWDNSQTQCAAAAALGAEIHDLSTIEINDLAALVLAPGIPLTHPRPHPAVLKAQSANIPVIGDIDLLYGVAGNAHYIAITGTNGKSTTTSLIGHIIGLEKPVLIGGNLGFPVLDFDKPAPGQDVVLELSSYQLDLTHDFTCSVAIFTNITPDHIDRHGNLAGYIAAKKKIFRIDNKPQTAVIGIDTPETAAIADELTAEGHWHVIRISGRTIVPGGIYVHNGVLYDDSEGNAVAGLAMVDAPALPGWHNAQNAAAAWAACRASGLAIPAIQAGIKSFAGIAHRQQRIAEHGPVVFINDSKATNADAAAMALTCYPRIYWIAGGRAKEGGLNGLEPLMNRVTHAYLIGEAEEEFARWMVGKVGADICGTLNVAVQTATRAALKDDQPSVVLLSPACASFDQFTNFETRGDEFTRLVQQELAHYTQRKKA